MSLDVTLRNVRTQDVKCPHCNELHQIEVEGGKEVYDANITHNLGPMAKAAGIYYALWRPEEIGISKAKYLIPLLQMGYDNLIANPTFYGSFNSPNGWGSYKNFVPFVKKYLEACIEYPEATIEVSR